jgi:hypothetical protein
MHGGIVMSPEFERGWILGYTQGQYNMRRILLRKLANPEALKKWLAEWPRKRRKTVRP